MHGLVKLSPFALWIGSTMAFGHDELKPVTPQVVRTGPHWLRPSTTKRGLSAFPKAPLEAPLPTYERVTVDDSGKKAWHLIPNDPSSESFGVVVRTKQGLKGELQAAQELFADCFPKKDPDPASRSDHFDWLPYYEDYPVHNLGWEAQVEEVELIQEGRYMVTVRLRPRLISRSLKTLLMDYVEEEYLLAGDELRLISSDAAIPRMRLQCFPAGY